MLLSHPFLSWKQKEGTFSSLKIPSTECRDALSLKEGSKFPLVCYSHISIIGVAGNLDQCKQKASCKQTNFWDFAQSHVKVVALTCGAGTFSAADAPSSPDITFTRHRMVVM